MAHKTGAAFSTGHIPHGCANAIYLPYVIKYNAKDAVAAKRYAEIARRMGLAGTSEQALINSLVEKIDAFNVKLNIPKTLKDFGINEEEFKEKVKDEITDHMSSKYKDCVVDIRETKKTNRTVEGLMLREIPGLSNASPTIYVNDLFEEYKKNGDFETVIDRAGEKMETAINSFDKDIAKDAINTSKMMDNVFFTLINAEQNRELLETVPHREFEDLAIVYRWNIGAGPDGVYTNLINNELAEKEGVTEEELFKAANENTKTLFPVTVKNMNEVIAEIIFDVGELDAEMSKEFEEVVNDVPDERSMYVISNASKLFGAASMLYEEPLHKLSEKLGSDLYILPSSTHEVIAISSNFGEPEELAEMVYEINMEQVDINDRLSNQVYHYDKDLRTLRLATDTMNKSLDDVDLGVRENTERGGR